MAVQFDTAPMTARCICAAVTGCATILLGSAAVAATPAATVPAGYSSAPFIKLIAGTYKTGCEQELVKTPGKKRPGGSIHIAEDGTFSSGKAKGVFRDEVSVLRGIEPNGGLNMMLTARDKAVELGISSDGQGILWISVIDETDAVQCSLPVPQQLKTATLYSVYPHVLDVSATLSCVKNGDKKKKVPFTYRLQQGVLRVFDQVYDLNKHNLETVRVDMGEYASNKFSYNAKMRDDSTVDLVFDEGKLAGLKTQRSDGTSYVCLAPGQAR